MPRIRFRKSRRELKYDSAALQLLTSASYTLCKMIPSAIVRKISWRKNWRKISGEPLNSRYPVRSVSVTMPPVHFQAWPEPSIRTALPIIHPYQILFAQHESLFNKTLTSLLISAQWSRMTEDSRFCASW
jgi:hypothetical protein